MYGWMTGRSGRPACTVILLIAAMAGCAGLMGGTEPPSRPAPVSPADVVLSGDGGTLYVAGETGNCVLVVDTPLREVTARIDLPGAVRALALSPDSGTVYAAVGSVEGKVAVIDTGTLTVKRFFPVGHTPVSLTLTPDGGSLYVCNRFDNEVTVLDTSTGETVASIPVMREPVASAMTPDGRYLFIANHLPSMRKLDGYTIDGGYMDIEGYVYHKDYSLTTIILCVDTADNRITFMTALPNGSTGVRGLCVSPDGSRVYITHILARYQVPTTVLDRGSMNTNALSIIDVDDRVLGATVLLDEPGSGAANPWGAACTPDGSRLLVSHAGTHEISSIDLPALHRRLAACERGDDEVLYTRSPEDGGIPVTDDLSFLRGIRSRIRLGGNGPRALVAGNETVHVAEYFTDTVSAVSLDGGGRGETVNLSPGHPSKVTAARLGERWFNDATLCYQTWQSCASCHPDGRSDALKWDLLNDGVGNPKNTKSLLLSHATPPVMITGIRPDAETAVRAGIRYIQFAPVDETVAGAIDAYLKSLEPVPSPYLDEGRLTALARRGRRVFGDAGCAECHPAPLYTDLRTYDVGTAGHNAPHTRFDTPTLIETWRTEPYLYDGRADSMDDVLLQYNRHDEHGETRKLTYEEINSLITFILSL